MGRIYSVSFTDIAVVAQQDLFQLESLIVPSTLHAVFLGQRTDLGDAEAEGLSIIIARVTDTVTNVTAEVPVDGGDAVATANINVNQTTELVAGISNIHSEMWNIALPFVYLPPPELRPTIKVSDALVVNLNTTPTDSITMSGTLYFEQIGN